MPSALHVLLHFILTATLGGGHGHQSRFRCRRLVAQSWLTLRDPTDCSLPGSSLHGISQEEYWSGLPFPPPGDLPDPGIEPTSLTSPALAGSSLPLVPPGPETIKLLEETEIACSD